MKCRLERHVKGVGDLVSPTRVFVKEGTIGVRGPRHASTSRMRVFLFNDLVLITTNEKQPTLKYRLSLEKNAAMHVS